MFDFVKIYTSGYHEVAWDELLAQGKRIRYTPLSSPALMVAKETMLRCRENIETLYYKLQQLGYQFKYPESAYVPSNTNLLEQLDQFESLAGLLPISLRMWYEVVGLVNFIGTHENFPNMSDGKYFPPDPIYVSPLDIAFSEYELWSNGESGSSSEEFLMPIAPDAYHKDDTSGGSAYVLNVPNEHIDGVLLREPHHTTFVNYVRICFRWGGFPGFENHKTPPEEIAYLTENLLPI